jgi:DNA-binding NarL/FixJ family response regulator
VPTLPGRQRPDNRPSAQTRTTRAPAVAFAASSRFANRDPAGLAATGPSLPALRLQPTSSDSETPTPRPRCLLVSAHPLALARLAERAGDLQPLPLCAGLGDLSLLTPHALSAADVVVVDVGSCDAPVAGWLHVVRARCPVSLVLAVGARRDARVLFEFLCLGVRGFVAYEAVDTHLASALRAVLAGHLVFPRSVVERAAEGASRRTRSGDGDTSQGLTPRERTVVDLVGRRHSNKDAAVALGITERTVRFHLANVFQKLRVHDRAAAVQALDALRKVEDCAASPPAPRRTGR